MSLQIPTPPPTRRRTPAGRNRPLEEANNEVKSGRRKGGKQGKFSLPIPAGLKKWMLYPAIILVVGALMVSANEYLDRMPLKEIQVNLLPGTDNAFMSEGDVIEAMGGENQVDYLGTPMGELNLEGLENTLLSNPAVAHVEVHKSMMGVLHIEIALREAVGRVINNSGLHLYVDADGNKFPTSPRHSAYVPLVRGDFEEGVVDTFSCSSVQETLPLLDFIRNDDFWRAQIAEVVIFQDGQIELLPTVSDLEIEFGYPVRIEEKFRNLMDFYRQVPSETGWRKYRSLSVKYRGQVVAKKR